MKVACFVLRAQPFHLGHLKAIKWILEKHEKVILVVGSSQDSHTFKNPFTIEERIQMIERSLELEGISKERYEIISVPDVNDDKLWVESILKKAKFDVVYTRNPWTARCFKVFDIPVEKHPIFDDISATEIRKKMKEGKNWENLVPEGTREVVKMINLKERLK